MSYESGWVPGRKRPGEDRLFRLTADDEIPAQLVQDQKAATTGPPPSAMRRLLEHDESRAAALRRGDTRAAKRAFAAVAADLDDLLDTAKAQLRVITSGDPVLVRDGVAALVATDALTTLPLGDVAELLDLPRSAADRVLTLLREDGGPSREDRRAVVRAIDELRLELQVATDKTSHSQLDHLIRVITTIAGLVALAVTAAALAALAVGDEVTREVAKAAIAALVALALERVTDLLRERDRDPRATAHHAHEALLRDLPDTEIRWYEPAYPGEPTIVRTTVLIRACAARIALIPLDWEDKQAYWDLLDRITSAVELGQPETISRLRRELTTVQPPTPG